MISQSNIQYPARITMLDSIALDEEVFNILKLQVNRILQIIPAWLTSKVELQVDLFLHFVMWKFSIHKQHCSFGQQLLNVKYNEEDFSSLKSYVLCLWKLVAVYLHHSSLLSTSRTSIEYSKRLISVFRCCELLNLLWFFREGKYPTLYDRILGLTSVNIVNKPRHVGYRYMIRELIWHGFIELAGFMFTLVNYEYLKRKFLGLFLFRRTGYVHKNSLNYTNSTVCVVCKQTPILPQHIGCSHVFCYYCIRSNRLLDSKFECVSCGWYRNEIEFVADD